MTNNQSNELLKAIEQCFIKNNMCDCGEEHKDLSIDETEFFDIGSVVKDIQSLIQDRERQARIDELELGMKEYRCNVRMTHIRLEQLKGDES